MFKLDLEKAEESEIKLPTSIGSLKKQESSRKDIYFCFIDYTEAFDCVDHNKLWKILKEMGIPGHLTCVLRNLYAGQEAMVRTEHETMDLFQIGKGVCQGCYCHHVYLAYMQSTSCKLLGWMKHKLEKDCQENINNLRYADDTTLMAESEEEQKSLLMKMKEESEKTGLKLSIQKWYSPIVSLQIDGETVIDFLFLGSKITADGDFSKWN